MRTYLLLFVLLQNTWAQSNEEQNNRQINKRMVGGDILIDNQQSVAYVSCLKVDKDIEKKCMGILGTNDTVLVPASCVLQSQENPIPVDYCEVEFLTARKVESADYYDGERSIYTIKFCFDISIRKKVLYDDDVAYIKLPTPISDISLPLFGKNAITSEFDCFVIGRREGHPNYRMHKMDAVSIDVQDCNKQFGKDFEAAQSLCVGCKTSKCGLTAIDSGAPLFCSTAGQKKPRLYGIATTISQNSANTEDIPPAIFKIIKNVNEKGYETRKSHYNLNNVLNRYEYLAMELPSSSSI